MPQLQSRTELPIWLYSQIDVIFDAEIYDDSFI